MPTQHPISVHFFAFLLASSAASMFPAAKSELTFAAYTIPTTPKGRQQNMVASIDSASHVLGHTFVSMLLLFLVVNVR